MEVLTAFVLQQGYLLLAAWVLLDQLGVPIPAVPVLVAAGALAGTGQLELELAIGAAVLGAIPADLFWYEAGRRRGGSVLRLLCRISLEPDSCVRQTEETFLRYGPLSLFVAKLVPGYQALAVALSGMSRIPLAQFLSIDILGALLWSGTYIGIGYLFHAQIDRVFALISDLGGWLVVASVVGLGLYVAWKYLTRRHFIRSLRVARIEPEELSGLIDAGRTPSVLDLRSAVSLRALPERVPGAWVMTPDEIESRHHELPRDRDIVLYCT